MPASTNPSEGPDPPARDTPGSRPWHLRFPDPARLELDQLVDSLLATAQEVQRTQGRVRALLRAVMTVTSESDLAEVLSQLVTSAHDLTGAAWVALVPDGSLGPVHEKLIHTGTPEPGRRARISAALPALAGLLTDHELARVDDATTLAAGDPPAVALLALAIPGNGGRAASLYLADKPYSGHSPGPFTAEDEELLQVLASAAGMAIDHALLLEQTRLREAWQHALTEMTAAILSDPDSDHALQHIAEQALVVADADTAVVTLHEPADDVLVVRAAAGTGSATLLGLTPPLDASLVGHAYTIGEPQMIDDARTGPRTAGAPPSGADLGPTMAVPLRDKGRPVGTLSVARAAGRRRFGRTELDLLAAFATQAALARRLAAHRSDDEELKLLQDRDRIGADLRERTIRDIYAIGLDLHSVALRLDPDRQQRLLRAVERIDIVIKDITTTVFDLRADPER